MSALPPIDQSLLPADVRKGTSEDKKLYATALSFERQLVDEMTKVMADTAQPVDGTDGSDSGDDSSDSGDQQDAATSMYTQMLPDQLADSITQNGGLGLARSFYDSLKEQAQ